MVSDFKCRLRVRTLDLNMLNGMEVCHKSVILTGKFLIMWSNEYQDYYWIVFWDKKAFLRPLIDYGDIIYDQPQNESFCEKLESVQYKAALAITGAIHGTSRNKIYQELGLESLKSRRWYRRLSCMYKIIKKEAPNYLIDLIPKCDQTIRTRSNHTPTYNCRTDCYKYSFFFLLH